MNKTTSFRTIRCAAIGFMAVAAMCLLSQRAEAQSCGYGGYHGGGSGFSFSIGRSYSGYGGGYTFGHNRNVYNRGISYSTYRPSNRYHYRRPVWHDTSHYDYHPGRLVPHGNHLDYVPGHYHFHRTGHWDH